MWGWIAVVGLLCCTEGPDTPAAQASAGAAASTSALPLQEIASVATLARAVALVRYLHPSDQAAALDWDAFLPGAIDRVRRAGDPGALVAELRAMFAAIAPTAAFATADDPPAQISPPRGATHLARWRRYGFGPTTPYPAFREGRDDETSFSVARSIRVALADPGRCGTARIAARVRRLGISGTVHLVLRVLLPGQAEQETPWSVPRGGEVAQRTEIPASAQAIELDLQVDGRAGATLEALSLTCSTGATHVIDPAAAGWYSDGPTDLYSWRTGRCAAGPCATLARNPLDVAFIPARDRLVADLGNAIRLELPLAVWADAARTLPAVPAPRVEPSSDPRTLRLAAVVATWGALAVFHPHLDDRRAAWLAALAPALDEAGRARDAVETRVALRHLLAVLGDGHATVSPPRVAFDSLLPAALRHLLPRLRDEAPPPASGVLPISLRRFGDRIIVTGGTDDERAAIPPGSELVALDGVPARAAYDRIAAQVSAGTAGLAAHLAAARLGAGPPGTVRQAQLVTAGGATVARDLTLVPSSGHGVRPARPWPGTELAPGVTYVDFDDLSPVTWTALVPALARSCALIFDFRGYSTTGLVAVSHLVDPTGVAPRPAGRAVGAPTPRDPAAPIGRPLERLTWQIPELPRSGGPAYAPVHRSLYPSAPRLTAPVIALVDGQSVSTVETILALVRDNHLGTLVGETSGGSSGLITTFKVPGGYTIRFTAIGLVEPDGATLYGRGITPDRVVHPTIAGIRDGRDEILDAGVEAARQLGCPRPVTP